METTPTYIPILRLREQEKGLLTTFDFGEDIVPYIEIFKHQPRKAQEPTEGELPKPKKEFNEIYLPILESIKSKKMFVDLPVHLRRSKKMKENVIEFLSEVVEDPLKRSAYLNTLSTCKRVIPVISTYSLVKHIPNTILPQESELRKKFSCLAFRTSETTFVSDMAQIESIAQTQDYLFVDLEEFCLSNPDDLDTVQFMLDRLKTFDKCNKVIINSPIHHTTTNSGLEHGMQLEGASNCLIDKFKDFGAHSFADYVGVKKDVVEEGGGISPGLIFYDAIENVFFGYKGRKWQKPEKPNLDDLREIIVRDLLTSQMVSNMQGSHLQYLSWDNKGWKMVNDMWDKTEKWRSQAKFKRIAMEHYIHCIKTKIMAGYFLI
jgi:hypothetical protein